MSSDCNLEYQGKILEATSRILDDRVSFKWKITNFSNISEKENLMIASPSFKCADAAWALNIYPNGHLNDKSVGNVGMYLVKVSSDTDVHSVAYKLAIKDDFDADHYTIEGKDIFKGNDSSWGRKAMVSRDELLAEKNKELLSKNTLKISCELTIFTHVVHENDKLISEEKKLKYTKLPCTIACVDSLSKDLAALYEDRKTCDITLKAEDKEFFAHRAILGARSPVFSAMFEHDMVEKRNNAVNISDIEASTLNDMLWYIYSGKVNDITVEKATNLFAAADRYALNELKAECTNVMLANISVDNVCKVAIVADIYQETALIAAVESFLGSNLSAVISTDQWDELLNERPRLAAILLQTISVKNRGRTK